MATTDQDDARGERHRRKEHPKRRWLPPDRYHFANVIGGCLELPCTAAWLYFLIFHHAFWVALLLALILGLATAFLLGWLIFLVGYGAISGLDRWRTKPKNDGS